MLYYKFLNFYLQILLSVNDRTRHDSKDRTNYALIPPNLNKDGVHASATRAGTAYGIPWEKSKKKGKKGKKVVSPVKHPRHSNIGLTQGNLLHLILTICLIYYKPAEFIILFYLILFVLI